MITNIVQFFLLFTPLVYSKQISLIYFESLVFYVFTISLFIGTFFDSKKREFKNIFLIIPLILMIINCFIFKFNPYSMDYLLNAFLFIFSLKIIIEYADSKIENYCGYIAAAIGINCFIFTVQNNGFNPFLVPSGKGYNGGMYVTLPRFATYLAITAPVLLYYSKVLYVIVLCYAGAIIVNPLDLSYIYDPQFGTLLSGLIILLFLYRNKYFNIIAISILIIFTIFNYDVLFNKFRVRLEILKGVIYYIVNNPICGIGLGLFPEELGKITANKDATVLSSFLQITMQCGIGFALLIGYYLKKFFQNINYSIPSLCILSIILMSHFEYVFEVKRNFPFIIFIIAIFIIDLIDKERDF